MTSKAIVAAIIAFVFGAGYAYYEAEIQFYRYRYNALAATPCGSNTNFNDMIAQTPSCTSAPVAQNFKKQAPKISAPAPISQKVDAPEITPVAGTDIVKVRPSKNTRAAASIKSESAFPEWENSTLPLIEVSRTKTAKVNWKAVPGAIEYQILIENKNGDLIKKIKSQELKAEIVDVPIKNGKKKVTYTVKVAAVAPDGSITKSSPKLIKIEAE